jgi:2-polyprenyl-3-methyl-5-hydroxy-6-metoxy-1,4-benzoquinol methylase
VDDVPLPYQHAIRHAPSLSATIIPLYDRRRHLASAPLGPCVTGRAWLTRFSAGLPDGAGVLDLGCGTGQPMGRWLAQQGFAITGVDSSAAMLYARALQPAQEWCRATCRRSRWGAVCGRAGLGQFLST